MIHFHKSSPENNNREKSKQTFFKKSVISVVVGRLKINNNKKNRMHRIVHRSCTSILKHQTIDITVKVIFYF